VRQIGRNTRSVDDIEERELVDVRRDLAEKREGLSMLARSFTITRQQ
jgi:DNA-binding MarR family transcriptional regulator